MAVGIAVTVLAAFVAGAGWRLGATYRGLAFLLVAAALGIVGRLEGVEEYVLLAVALGVLLAAGPIVLWHRAERAVGMLQVELRPSSHEIPAGTRALLSVTVSNVGSRTCGPMRLEPPDEGWQLSRPGLRHRLSDMGAGGSSGGPEGGLSAVRRERGWRSKVANGDRVPSLGPMESAGLDFEIPTSARGVLAIPHLKLWCLDAFELFAYEMVISTETSIIVVPEVMSPRSVVNGVLQPAGRIDWSPPASGEATGGPGFDLSGLRQYVPGDRLRLLHWPTLARTGELFVRDFEGSGTDAVTIIMDDRKDVISPREFEAIVSTTAGIATEATRQRLGLELHTPGGVHLDLPSGPTLSRSLLRVLATLDLVSTRSSRSVMSAIGFEELAEKQRVVVSTSSAVGSLPELLRSSSTVIVV
jgi:uncharacterized protein (DUF58 family)